jgi:hypothetical protein
VLNVPAGDFPRPRSQGIPVTGGLKSNFTMHITIVLHFLLIFVIKKGLYAIFINRIAEYQVTIIEGVLQLGE